MSPVPLQLWHFVDVAVGLIFVYLLLGMLASQFKETVSGILNWRGEQLKGALVSMLSHGPDVSQQTDTLFKAVFRHGLISPDPSGRAPAYVSARNFSASLTSVLADPESVAPLLAQVKAGIDALPDGRARQSLQTLLQQAQGDMQKFNLSVEHWFDDTMDRLSGSYKRFCGYFLLVIGAVLAVSFNIDSVRIAQFLWANPVLAQGLADQASVAMAAAPASAGAASAVASDAIAAAAKTYATLADAQLPVGWAGSSSVGALTVPGWAITALSVSLGAPFWFDLLGRVLNLRAAGPKPKKTDDR